MRIDSVLLFLLMLRYGYEKNPLRYAIVRGILEQFPTVLPEQYRSPMQVIKLIDMILTPSVQSRVRIEPLNESVRQLREFAGRFA
jgi:hypothetical protein